MSGTISATAVYFSVAVFSTLEKRISQLLSTGFFTETEYLAAVVSITQVL